MQYRLMDAAHLRPVRYVSFQITFLNDWQLSIVNESFYQMFRKEPRNMSARHVFGARCHISVKLLWLPHIFRASAVQLKAEIAW